MSGKTIIKSVTKEEAIKGLCGSTYDKITAAFVNEYDIPEFVDNYDTPIASDEEEDGHVREDTKSAFDMENLKALQDLEEDTIEQRFLGLEKELSVYKGYMARVQKRVDKTIEDFTKRMEELEIALGKVANILNAFDSI